MQRVLEKTQRLEDPESHARLFTLLYPQPPMTHQSLSPIDQGSPTPSLQTGTSLRPVRNQATQQEVSGGQASKASSAAPHCSYYRLNHLHPHPWKNCLPRNWSLLPKRLGTTAMDSICLISLRSISSYLTPQPLS